MIGSVVDVVTGKAVLTLDDQGQWGGELKLFGELSLRQPGDWRIPEGDPSGLLEVVAESIRTVLNRVVRVELSPETRARLREEELRVLPPIH